MMYGCMELAEFFQVRDTMYIVTPKGATDCFEGLTVQKDGTLCFEDGRPIKFLATQEQGRAYRDAHATNLGPFNDHEARAKSAVQGH